MKPPYTPNRFHQQVLLLLYYCIIIIIVLFLLVEINESIGNMMKK